MEIGLRKDIIQNQKEPFLIMTDNSTKQHWEEIYGAKNTINDVSWYQGNPQTSVNLITSVGIDNHRSNVIDIGGGDSVLVDKLLELGFENIFVLDISTQALQKAKTRLMEKAKLVTWIDKNVLDFDTVARFDVWHDRATFHFLTKKEDIDCYIEVAVKLIKPSGYLIISTFSINGPKKCSGLDITQYSENSIKNTFQKDFRHINSFEKIHVTPFNTKQIFLFNLFRRK